MLLRKVKIDNCVQAISESHIAENRSNITQDETLQGKGKRNYVRKPISENNKGYQEKLSAEDFQVNKSD